MFIGISGIIGAGKTVLTEKLAKELNYKVYYEPVKENAYLADFYKDPKRWGAIMQFYLLTKRFEQHQQIIWSNENGAVQDRTIYEDTIFAEMLYKDGLINKRDYTTYMEHYNIMKRYLVYPDVIIYLDVKPQKALERIKSRGRNAEKSIPLEYLNNLYQGYEEFLKDISQWTTVLRVDYSSFKETNYFTNLIEEVPDRSRFFKSIRKI